VTTRIFLESEAAAAADDDDDNGDNKDRRNDGQDNYWQTDAVGAFVSR